MSKRRVTLFELHTHDSVQFGPRSLRRGAEPEAEPEEEEEEGGRSLGLTLLLAGLVLAGAAYAYTKYAGGDEDEAEVREEIPMAESDDVTATAD